MRGRTNITQRTGVAVIGTDVANKQVIGQSIAMGDFVEFTGDTTTQQILINNMDFPYYCNFKISNTVFGVVLYNNTSKTLKIVIFNVDGILKEQSFTGLNVNFGFEREYDVNYIDNDFYMHASYVDGKIYVGFTPGFDSVEMSTYLSRLIQYDFLLVYTVDGSYNIAYSTTKSMRNLYNELISNSPIVSGRLYITAPFVIGNKIYLFVVEKSNNLGTFYLYPLNLSDVSVNNRKNFGDFSFNKYEQPYYKASINILDDYIFAGDSSSFTYYAINGDSIIKNYVLQDVIFTQNSNLIYKDGYFFLGCVIKGETSIYCKVFVFYKSGSNFVLSAQNQVESFTTSYSEKGCVAMMIKNNNNVFNIDVVFYHRVLSQYLISYLQFISSNSTLVRRDKEQNLQVIGYPYLLLFEKQQGENCLIDVSQSKLRKQLYSIVDNNIIFVQGLDLVRKVTSGRADGVAKTSGSVGDRINVCIP